MNLALVARLTSFGCALAWATTWVDDEITDADRAWVAAQLPGRALLHRAEPKVGRTERDFVVLEEWQASEGR